MELKPGAKLGPYEIVSPIGKGGMGEVWKARDPRLNRDVAIKISAQQFTDRFEREAHAIAALNHTNVCTLYDVGPNYLVMELVEGPTLAEHIAQGPIPLEEALAIAKQIADALEAAHNKAIVHRDLKPANVKIKPDGSVKVLDFGLAKLGELPALTSDSPTMMSIPGMILGTAGYMSPEQARGKDVDKRADIWAFGVVLYEMLTGKRLFEGETISDTLAAVIKEEPDLTKVPAKVQRLLRRCLEKDPKKRLRDITGVEFLLEDAEPAVVTLGKLPWIAAAALFALLAAALAFVHFREAAPTEQTIYSSIALPENSDPGFLALSPDGRHLVASLTGEGKRQLYLRSLDAPQWRPLASTDSARVPFWSPDGKFIGFFADGKLKTIPASGGPAQSLCAAGSGSGGAWNRDGVILFATEAPGPILRVNASGGACTPVTKAAPASAHRLPEFLPDGKHFLYVIQGNDESTRGIYLASLDDPNGRRLLADQSGVIYTPPPPGGRYSRLLFLRETTLMAQPFDDSKLQIAGDPSVVVEQASTSRTVPQPAASASANGILAYIANNSVDKQLAWFDRAGKLLGKVGPSGGRNGVALSPDEKTVAIFNRADSSVWLRDLVRESESRLVEGGNTPIWSPDGRSVVYTKNNDLYLKNATGGGSEAEVLQSANPKFASDWSRDGRFLLYTEVDPKTRGDIWYLADPRTKDGAAKPVRYLGTSAMESQAQFSPDARWVAYFSDESGKGEVYISPFPSGNGQWKVSTNGGREPRWSSDGKELYYFAVTAPVNDLMATPVRAGREGNPEIGTPQKLFGFRGVGTVQQRNAFLYSPAADGRFLVNIDPNTAAPAINLIANWQKLATAAKEQ